MTQLRKFSEWFNWRWFLIFAIVLGASMTFLELAEDVWFNEGFKWDVPLILSVHSFSYPALDLIFKAITMTAGAIIFAPILIFCFWFWRKQSYYQIGMLLFSVIGMGIITTILKLLFQRPRPDVFVPLVTESSYSFPSGHTGAAVALFGLAGTFFWQDNQRIVALLCWLWVFLVMLSRIYLGAHYPSDVLASLMLGIIWIILLNWKSLRKPQN